MKKLFKVARFLLAAYGAITLYAKLEQQYMDIKKELDDDEEEKEEFQIPYIRVAGNTEKETIEIWRRINEEVKEKETIAIADVLDIIKQVCGKPNEIEKYITKFIDPKKYGWTSNDMDCEFEADNETGKIMINLGKPFYLA